MILWLIATVLLVICGTYYTFRLGFIQFNFKKMFASLKNGGVSSFKSLTLSLAARIGVGSLSGIALAIYQGGVGVVFWIWLSTLLTLPNTFAESVLAVVYQEKVHQLYQGGPAYYISKGLGYKRLAFVYAFLIVLCYLGGFMAIQANTMAFSLLDYCHLPTFVTGIVISFLAYGIIVKGLHKVVDFTSKIVPLMGIIYLIVVLVIMIKNVGILKEVFKVIFHEALNFRSMGWGIIGSILIGVQRGLFSSESGLGTGAIASGSSCDTPLKQGYLQMFGVYFTSFIICTGTALIILTSDISLNGFNNPNGIEITQRALNSHFGNFGLIILILMVLAFSFSTIISGYYYGESNLAFIYPSIRRKRNILNLGVILLLFVGAVARPIFLWKIVDILVALLAIINTVALLLLRRDVVSEVEYDRKRLG